MLTVSIDQPRPQGGVSRRTLLRAGCLALGGLTLADHLRLRAAEPRRPANDTAVILVWLGGGIPHIDMYDMKPDAPAEVRGEFKPIQTNVAGIQVCEHMPLQARLADRFALVRTLSHTHVHHGMAMHWVMTGHPLPSLVNDDRVGNDNPSCGSVVARMRGPNRRNLPAYACVPFLNYRLTSHNAAYLGAGYNPFVPYRDSSTLDMTDPRTKVDSFHLPPDVNLARLDDRRALRQVVDGVRRDLDRSRKLDRFYGDAFDMLSTDACRDAFDLTKESPKLQDRYGRNPLGQAALLSRRLVEAGVTFVTINATYTIKAANGWDTHYDNFPALKDDLLPRYDRFFSALIEDLYERGLDRKVLVVAVGEFGHTPRINNGGGFGGPGRDHWPGANSAVLVGGGLKMGQIIGQTDRLGAFPTTHPISPQDLLATVYRFLGIDHHHEFRDHTGRPVPVLYGARPIESLFG